MCFFFFSSRRRHTRFDCDWSSDVCSSDLQRTIACGAPVDTALQALLLQARLDLDRAVGAVRPDLLAGVGEVEHIVQLLTVVHGRVRRIPFADQLVRLVHADMVLVAVEALVVLLRPARVRVLLRILGRLLLPSLRRLAGLGPVGPSGRSTMAGQLFGAACLQPSTGSDKAQVSELTTIPALLPRAFGNRPNESDR